MGDHLGGNAVAAAPGGDHVLFQLVFIGEHWRAADAAMIWGGVRPRRSASAQRIEAVGTPRRDGRGRLARLPGAMMPSCRG